MRVLMLACLMINFSADSVLIELSVVSTSKPLEMMWLDVEAHTLDPSTGEAERAPHSFKTTRTTNQRPNSNEDSRDGSSSK